MKSFNLINILIAFAFILLPFNSLPLFKSWLGEARGEGALYPFILIVSILLFKFSVECFSRGSCKINSQYTYILLLCITFLVTFPLIFNFNQILMNDYMEKNGLIRFLSQSFLLLLSIIFVFVISKYVDSVKKVDSLITISRNTFYFVFLFAIYQFLVYYLDFGGAAYYLVGSIIYEEGVIDYALNVRQGLGLHSVSQEPSFLAMYLAVIFPFIFLMSKPKTKIIILLMSSVLIYLTWSRTAYVIYLVQLFMILYLSIFKYISLSKLLLFLFFYLFLIVVFLSGSPILEILISTVNVSESGSSAARLGAAYSAILAWLDHNLIFGVGIGQAGYYLIDYLPPWSFISNDTVDVVNGERWPPIHNLWARILVETGLSGLVVFLVLFGFLFYRINNIIKLKFITFKEIDYFGYATLVSIFGVVLIMFNRETFTNMNIWLSLGLALSYIKINKNYKCKY